MSRQLDFDFGLPPAPRPPVAPEAERREKVPVPPRPKKPEPFNYTRALQAVVRDVVDTLPELKHVDLDYVLLSIAQARQSSKHGVYASCFALRFEGGAPDTLHRGRTFRMPVLQHEGREMKYIVYFMLPRFHEEQDYHEKLATVIHELYHISPQFNGDIRRFPGKNFAHGHSRERYHAAMRKLADKYLATSPRAGEHEFLQRPFEELLALPGGVVGTCVARPKPYLVDKKK